MHQLIAAQGCRFQSVLGVFAYLDSGALKSLDDLRLIFLNACRSGAMEGRSTPESPLGVASALVLSEQKTVIAMQLPISDPGAIRFSKAVYGALADGEPIEAAVTRGRLAIFNRNGTKKENA